MQQNCNPQVRAAPLSPISPYQEFSVPRSLLLALHSSLAITSWAHRLVTAGGICGDRRPNPVLKTLIKSQSEEVV